MFFKQIIEFLNSFGAFILSFGAIIIAFIAFRFSKKTYNTNISIELFKEYKSNEMGEAIKYLWDKYNVVCSEYDIKRFSREGILVNLYIAEYQNNLLDFHFARRKVSCFFQEMATFFELNKLDKKIIKSFFLQERLDIIHKILLPLELNALPLCINKALTKIPLHFKAMVDLYNNFGANKFNITTYKKNKGYNIYVNFKQTSKNLRKIGINQEQIFLNDYVIISLKEFNKAKYKIKFMQK